MIMSDSSVAARFWPKVNRDGPVPAHRPELGPCWVWTATHNARGYGQITIARRCEKAHRVAVHLAGGYIPWGVRVLHHCDNPACVRLSHLFLGTDGDNARDRERKGRGIRTGICRRGEQHPRAKLTVAQVIEMRRRYADRQQTGVRQIDLAAEFRVSRSTIEHALSGLHWAEVAPSL